MNVSAVNHRRLLFAMLLASVPLNACNFKEEKDGEDAEDVTIDPSTPVSFAEIQTQVLQPYCLGCHSAAAGNHGAVNLETYAVVKAQAAAIKSSTVDSTRMPKGSRMSANLRALLGAWIAQATPE